VACSSASRRWLNNGKVLRRPRRGHGEGAGQGGEGRGAPERWVDGEAAQTALGGGVRRRGGGSGGWRQRVWVLQHQRGKGVRELQENAGIGSSGRSSLGSGGRRWCSAGIREGEWAAGGRCGGLGAGSGGEARALERRGRRGVETGGRVNQRERGASDSAAARQRGKERRENVGVRAWGCHAARGCRGAWP
jgi:hypothetical protein